MLTIGEIRRALRRAAEIVQTHGIVEQRYRFGELDGQPVRLEDLHRTDCKVCASGALLKATGENWSLMGAAETCFAKHNGRPLINFFYDGKPGQGMPPSQDDVVKAFHDAADSIQGEDEDLWLYA